MISGFSFAAPLLFAGSLFGPQTALGQETGSYEFTGDLNKPYQPAGGVGVDAADPPPVYAPLSNFDFQSLNLALNQEWIELDLFHHGLAIFSDEEFEAWNITTEDRYLIQFMVEQKVGHVTALTNILGPNAAKPCNYTYPFQTVGEFINLCQILTRWGEAGVYGFLPHLNSQPSAQILLQSITTKARQQMAFTQFQGLFPMPFWFNTGLSQSMTWTLLAPYITSCPAVNPKIEWQNFPALTVTNNPNATNPEYGAAISTNRTALSYANMTVEFQWELPGQNVSYGDGLYVTNTTAGTPRFAAWVSQLNVTYTELTDVNTTNRTASTQQPGTQVYTADLIAAGVGNSSVPIVNGTVFVMLVDTDLFVTPYNMSLLNDHVVAGPAVYQSG